MAENKSNATAPSGQAGGAGSLNGGQSAAGGSGQGGATSTGGNIPKYVVVNAPKVPKALSTDLTPYQGVIEPNSKEGIIHWGNATKAP